MHKIPNNLGRIWLAKPYANLLKAMQPCTLRALLVLTIFSPVQRWTGGDPGMPSASVLTCVSPDIHPYVALRVRLPMLNCSPSLITHPPQVKALRFHHNKTVNRIPGRAGVFPAVSEQYTVAVKASYGTMAPQVSVRYTPYAAAQTPTQNCEMSRPKTRVFIQSNRMSTRLRNDTCGNVGGHTNTRFVTFQCALYTGVRMLAVVVPFMPPPPPRTRLAGHAAQSPHSGRGCRNASAAGP